MIFWSLKILILRVTIYKTSRYIFDLSGQVYDKLSSIWFRQE